MTLSKYNEVMKNIKVTPEMKDRLIAELEKESEKSFNKSFKVESHTDKIKPFLKLRLQKYLPIAGVAVVAIFVIGFISSYMNQHTATETAMESAESMENIESAKDSFLIEEADIGVSDVIYYEITFVEGTTDEQIAKIMDACNLEIIFESDESLTVTASPLNSDLTEDELQSLFDELSANEYIESVIQK